MHESIRHVVPNIQKGRSSHIFVMKLGWGGGGCERRI